LVSCDAVEGIGLAIRASEHPGGVSRTAEPYRKRAIIFRDKNGVVSDPCTDICPSPFHREVGRGLGSGKREGLARREAGIDGTEHFWRI